MFFFRLFKLFALYFLLLFICIINISELWLTCDPWPEWPNLTPLVPRKCSQGCGWRSDGLRGICGICTREILPQPVIPPSQTRTPMHCTPSAERQTIVTETSKHCFSMHKKPTPNYVCKKIKLWYKVSGMI